LRYAKQLGIFTPMKAIEYKIGQQVKVYGGWATIRRVHGMGTVDVEDSRGKWFRVTGLPMFDLNS
jgi:hypothetical protein